MDMAVTFNTNLDDIDPQVAEQASIATSDLTDLNAISDDGGRKQSTKRATGMSGKPVVEYDAENMIDKRDTETYQEPLKQNESITTEVAVRKPALNEEPSNVFSEQSSQRPTLGDDKATSS
jgi:hypothetical protein